MSSPVVRRKLRKLGGIVAATKLVVKDELLGASAAASSAGTSRRTRMVVLPWGRTLIGVVVGLVSVVAAAALLSRFGWLQSALAWAAFDVGPVARWWIVLAALGLVVAPITRNLTGLMPDGGHATNHMFGLILVS